MIEPHPLIQFDRPASIPFPRRISLFGSTGSIGISTLEIIRRFPNKFVVETLVAGSNVERILGQAIEFRPNSVALAEKDKAIELRSHLNAHGLSSIEVYGGNDEISQLAFEDGGDIHVAAIVGMAGLSSVLRALESGKVVALANKESLVVGGHLVAQVLDRTPQALLIPVDSEHSAIFQALQGETSLSRVESLILTASGGPFRTMPLDQFSSITPEDAINHPRWKMGPKVSIDSATMMNKALEVIEACWLFGLSEHRVEVLIHPQSIIHSFIRFIDGSLLAQMSVPDMKGPIGFALGYPKKRLTNVMERLSLTEIGQLEFEGVQSERFPSIDLVRQAIQSGPVSCIVLNMANEVAVERFTKGELFFSQIIPFISDALTRFSSEVPETYEDLSEFCQFLKEELWQGL
ncbi:MAG: 1-deoxy-D-xylulose-5-phosphate reductoisomerase [Bdellovibrionales bacterium]|nr:1-deoxy-D-xylulose-5-phosphate reductoisomerase [Bdellovibrionales bacterium]